MMIERPIIQVYAIERHFWSHSHVYWRNQIREELLSTALDGTLRVVSIFYLVYKSIG